MQEIKMSNGNTSYVFYVFSNGNALYLKNGKIRTIEDFADKYIMLRENGFEEVDAV